jgi:glycerol dehydrogenase
VQGPGAIERIGDHARAFAENALVLVDAFVEKQFGLQIDAAMSAAGVWTRTEVFGGECSADEIARVTEVAHACSTGVVIGLGGGKTLDTAKCVAVGIGRPMIMVPTIASTDAPCSAIAVQYTPDGLLDRGLFLGRNPDLVLVDSAIIAAAPVRFLAAGIGDAYSTWIEARSNVEAGQLNYVGERYAQTAAGLAIARACHDVLTKDAVAAITAVRAGLLTPAVEAIIEANTLLSGLGFENCGVSAAHGISDAIGVIDPEHKLYHGEKVAFGILCLLVLEGRPLDQFREAALFLDSIGLPTRLDHLGLGPVTDAHLDDVAEAALGPGASSWRVAVPLSKAAIRASIRAADALAARVLAVD